MDCVPEIVNSGTDNHPHPLRRHSLNNTTSRWLIKIKGPACCAKLFSWPAVFFDFNYSERGEVQNSVQVEKFSDDRTKLDTLWK